MNKHTAVCIGCGCSDVRACAEDGWHQCYWIEVSYEEQKGICSECWPLADRPGDHLVADPDFSAQRFAELLGDLYPSDDARAWFDSPQKLLGNKSPRELIEAGEIAKVRTAVQALLDGAYL